MGTSLEKIGRELARQREARGISKEELSAASKISIQFIEKIENGDLDFLPQVYVRAFIRSYAEQVGLDPNVMLAQFKSAKRYEMPAAQVQKDGTIPETESRSQVAEEKSTVVPHQEHEPPQAIKDLQFYFTLFRPFILVGIGIIILFVIIRLLFPNTREAPTRAKQQEIAPSVADTLTRESQAAQNELVPETGHLSMQLTITAIETTWMRFVFNDSIADEATFAPGDMRTWESDKDFYLLLGNASGVKLTLNGKNLGIVGNPGQVTNLRINEESIKRIPYSSFPPAMNRARRNR